MMTNLITYNDFFSDIVINELKNKLELAMPGHCLRLEGLPLDVLHTVCLKLQSEVPKAKVVLLSNEPIESYEVTATKLIELRNLTENSNPLLVLIPSTLRTAAEDSFDKATFKQIDVSYFQTKLVTSLEDKIPSPQKNYFERIKTFFQNAGGYLKPYNKANYLIVCLNENFTNLSMGNNLYQIGLIPDDELLTFPEHLEQRLHQNYKIVEALKDDSQPVLARILALEVEQKTIQKSLFDFLTSINNPEDIDSWGKLIVQQYNHLNLKHWKFTGMRSLEELEVFINPLQGKSVIYQDGEKRIVTKENRDAKINVSFMTKPGPMELNALTHFRIDLMRTNDEGKIEKVETLLKFAKTSGKTATRTKQISFDPNQIAEGVYFLRVLALDEAGTILNKNDAFKDSYLQKEWLDRRIKDRINASREDLQGKLTCDSEDFYFRIEGSDEDFNDGKNTGRREKASNLFEAIVQARLDYIQANQYNLLDSLKVNKCFWTDQGSSKKRECNIEVQFSDVKHNYVIPLATSLRSISIQLLKASEKLGQFRLDLSKSGLIESGEPYLRDNKLAEIAPDFFLEARKQLFLKIHNQIKDDNGNFLGIFESTDLQLISDDIEKYLAAYQQWIDEVLVEISNNNPGSLITLKNLLLLDHIEIIIPISGSYRERVFLLSPIHPLRLGWFLNLQKLYYQWERISLSESSGPKQMWNEDIRNIFLGGIQPSNHPLVIHGGNLRAFCYSGEIAPGWGLYTPLTNTNLSSDVDTSRVLFDKVQELLGIPTTLRDEADHSLKNIYRQVRRYLIQHPYIDVLQINMFNPGDGRKLVECLKQLQQEKLFEKLRYEIRLIAPEKQLGEIGTVFNDFLRPSGSISDEVDIFTVPTSNALFPKIRFSRNSIEDYLLHPQEYESHISILFELFPMGIQLIKSKVSERQSVFCHGLIVDPVNENSSMNEDVIGWNHYLAINDALPIKDEDFLAPELIKTLKKLEQMVAIALAGKWTTDIPAISISLIDYSRTLIFHIHEFSDWVITIDRNLGVDLFDSPTDLDCIPYLLDYNPGNEFGELPVFLTTKPTSEVFGLLMPFLIKHGLIEESETTKLTSFLEVLRSVSGSVIMQLTSSPLKAFETIGIGLSRLLLKHLNILEDHFIIPLDEHINLFENAQRNEEYRTMQRGDLLIISCDPAAQMINIQAIEIKCRTSIPDSQALDGLKSIMTEQLDHTVSCLQFHFDPALRIPDRLDRSIKNQQLYKLLDFYLCRAKRYNLMSELSFINIKHFLLELDHGYKVSFKRTGLIFEFEKGPEEVKIIEESPDLIFFHVGRNTINRLLKSLDSIGDEEKNNDKPLTQDLITVKSFIEEQTSQKSIKNKTNSLPNQISDNTVNEQYRTSHIIEKDDKGLQSEQNELNGPEFGEFIGETETTPQFGILASTLSNKKVAMDLNGCNTLSLFGVPGGGKSYTLGTIVEMALQQVSGINLIPSPLASVIFHYHESQDYPPEFLSMRFKNTNDREVDLLEKIYKAKPQAIKNILLLTPKDKVKERKLEYPDVIVAPIAFSSRELSIKDWKFLMGAVGNQAMYMQHLNMIMRRGRDNLTLDFIRQGVDGSSLSDNQKEYAFNRLELAEQFIDDSSSLRDLLEPGKLVVVDLRDEFIEKEQALGLFVVMLNIFSGAKAKDGTKFNKLIAFDEAHKYITHSDLTSHVVEVIRQMRHQGVTMLIASQDPPSLPNEIIELSSTIILHRFNSPQWLKHIQKSVVALNDLTPSQLAALQPGEAFIWANKATNPEWTKKAIKVITRPRFTLHGGSTQKAIN